MYIHKYSTRDAQLTMPTFDQTSRVEITTTEPETWYKVNSFTSADVHVRYIYIQVCDWVIEIMIFYINLTQQTQNVFKIFLKGLKKIVRNIHNKHE